jgi:hypothetical protein
MAKRLSTLVVVALAGGCVDAKGAYDDFASRVVDAAPKPDADPTQCPSGGTTPDMTGRFLFGGRGVSTQTKDILFDITVTYTAGTDGGGTMDLSYKPLKFDSREPSSMPEALPPMTGVVVDNCGRWEATLVGTLPGDADPVIPGTALMLNAINTGKIYSADFVCGALTGTAQGAPLNGRFAWTRVPVGGPLPAEQPNECSDNGFPD